MASQILPMQQQEFPLSVRAIEDRDRSPVTDALLNVLSALPVWAWFMPVVAVTMLLLASGPALPWFVGKYAWTGKDFQEILGPSLLGAALFVAAFQCVLRGGVCRVWMLCIPLTFLCRELHFAGTGTGVYVGLAAIIWFAIRNAGRLQPIWNCRNACGAWFGAACFYGLAVTVDSGVWKFLPHAQAWGVNLEETMESLGHLLILSATLFGVAIVDRISLVGRSSRA
jgi:hypothetical protein